MPGTPIAIDHLADAQQNAAFKDKVSELAIPDIARYQEQLLKMILHHDDRALKVLSLYVTVLGALVTAILALRQANLLTSNLITMIVGAGLTLVVGCVFAYQAAWTARIYLPGRKSDFWMWAIQNNLTVHETASAYAQQAVDTIAHNERVSNRAANRLTKAYVSGLVAPIVGAAATWIVFWSK